MTLILEGASAGQAAPHVNDSPRHGNRGLNIEHFLGIPSHSAQPLASADLTLLGSTRYIFYLNYATLSRTLLPKAAHGYPTSLPIQQTCPQNQGTHVPKTLTTMRTMCIAAMNMTRKKILGTVRDFACLGIKQLWLTGPQA